MGTVIDMRPIGWGEMTPRQWSVLRNLIREVEFVASRAGNTILALRARHFLVATEGRDG